MPLSNDLRTRLMDSLIRRGELNEKPVIPKFPDGLKSFRHM